MLTVAEVFVEAAVSTDKEILADEAAIRELTAMELAVIGGGTANVAFV